VARSLFIGQDGKAVGQTDLPEEIPLGSLRAF
jgi:hypothetical protein